MRCLEALATGTQPYTLQAEGITYLGTANPTRGSTDFLKVRATVIVRAPPGNHARAATASEAARPTSRSPVTIVGSVNFEEKVCIRKRIQVDSYKLWRMRLVVRHSWKRHNTAIHIPDDE